MIPVISEKCKTDCNRIALASDPNWKFYSYRTASVELDTWIRPQHITPYNLLGSSPNVFDLITDRYSLTAQGEMLISLRLVVSLNFEREIR